MGDAGGAYSEAAYLTQDAQLWERAQVCFAEGQNWEQAARCVSERRELAADGHEKALLCAQEADFLDNLGDVDGVEILGRRPLTELEDHYHNAACFCMPSRLEPFGVVFVVLVVGKEVCLAS